MVNTEIRLIIFFAPKDGEALYSQQTQEWELTVAQIMNSLLPNSNLKKVGKTTRPFRYDLNKIPYNYTVEVRNRFKGLDLMIEGLTNYGWRFMTLYKRQGSRLSGSSPSGSRVIQRGDRISVLGKGYLIKSIKRDYKEIV